MCLYHDTFTFLHALSVLMTVALPILISLLFITEKKLLWKQLHVSQHFYFILGRFMLVDHLINFSPHSALR